MKLKTKVEKNGTEYLAVFTKDYVFNVWRVDIYEILPKNFSNFLLKLFYETKIHSYFTDEFDLYGEMLEELGYVISNISKDRKQGTLENDIYHKRGRTKESNLTKEDWKERYEILKKYQAFLKAQRERK